MNYKGYIAKLFFRIIIISACICGIVYFIYNDKNTYTVLTALLLLFVIFQDGLLRIKVQKIYEDCIRVLIM